MAFQWLMNWLTGQMVLVDAPSTAAAPPATGTFLFVDNTGFSFADATNIDFIT